MATLIADSYTRADAPSTPGSPTTGGPYTVRVGTWGIIGNQMYTSVSTAESVITYPSAVDCDITVTLSNAGDKGIIHGWTDANNYYMLSYNLSNIGLYRKVAGTFALRSPLIPTTGTVVARLVMFGRAVYMYNGTTLIWSGEDDLPSASTRPAVSGYRSHSNITARFDDLLAVDSAAYAGATGVVSSASLFDGGVGDARASRLWKGRDRAALDDAAAA